MKNTLLICLLIFNCKGSYAQQYQLKGCPKIYHASAEVLDTSCDLHLKKVFRSIFGGSVRLTYENGRKDKVSAASIWGYRTKNEYPTRIVQDSDYSLVATTPVCIYKHLTGRNYSYNYYSIALDSPIHSIKHLKKTRPDLYNKLKQDDYLRRKVF